jgi:molybdate transport system substrate-binding protein
VLIRSCVAALAMLLVVVAAACSDDGGDDDGASQEEGSATSLVIWAPNQIKSVTDNAIRVFQQKHPDVEIQVVNESAAELKDRLLLGERPDLIFGSARQLNELIDTGRLPENFEEFGADVMQIVVAPGNPKGIREVSVFGNDPTTTSGLCDANSSCGKAARTVLDKANIEPLPDVSAPTASALLDQIETGAVDAGLLFRSQTAKAEKQGQVSTVPLPETSTSEVQYRIVEVRSGDASKAFLTLMKEGAQVKNALRNAGLAPPAPAAP